MTIDDVYVNIDNISSVKYNFKHIRGFESVFENMMRHLYKYLSILIEPWTANDIFATWIECYIGDEKYSQGGLSHFVKSSVNQTNGYNSYYLLPFDEISGWNIIIYKSTVFDCSIIYFVNVNIGRTIEIYFKRKVGYLDSSSLKKLKDVI